MELLATLNPGVVQRECRKSKVSLLTRSTDVAWLKMQIFEKRGWSETCSQQQGPMGTLTTSNQFVVEKILATQVTQAGVQQFLVQWASSDECQ